MSPVCSCLSAEVDLFAAIVIGAIGIDALRHVSYRRQLALAVIPITLAAHQLIEVGVWWSLDGRVPEQVGSISATLYLVIALIVVPVLIPFAVLRIEPDPRKRLYMKPFLALGVVTAAIFGAAMVYGPIQASIGGHYVDYRVGSVFLEPIGALYITAVAVPLLLSSHRLFVWLGAANLIVIGGLIWVQANALVSLWCAAAALESIVIAHFLRSESGNPWQFSDRLRSLRPPISAR